MKLAYVKIAFAALALIGGVVLMIVGGEQAFTTAVGLVTGALGLVGGQVATVDSKDHDTVVSKLTAARAEVRKVTGEAEVVAKVGL